LTPAGLLLRRSLFPLRCGSRGCDGKGHLQIVQPVSPELRPMKHGAVPVDLSEIWIRLHYGDQPKPKGTGKLVI
jgi:hypothetical protein